MRWPARVAGTLLCLLVAAWFGLCARQAHDTARAQSVVSSGQVPSRAQARRVEDLLRAAGQLNPDRQVAVLRATLADELGHRATGLRIISGVTHAEPENAQAWVVQARSSGHAGALAALGHLIVLVHQPR